MWMNTPIKLLSVVVMSLLGIATGQQCAWMQETCNNNYYSSYPGNKFGIMQMLNISHGIRSTLKCEYMWTCTSYFGKPDCLHNCHYYLSAGKTRRKKRDDMACNLDDRYRTINGECNNLNNPEWGRFGRPYNRLVPAAYDDGMSTPRQTSACNGSLPSARLISNTIHQSQGLILLEKRASYMTMQWGQFIAHDLTVAPIQSDGSPECCGVDMDSEPCFSIEIPPLDPHFDTDCMDFIRSQFVTLSGVREQFNEQTSFIDGSMLYGPTADVQASLRITGGLLDTAGKKLGIDPDDSNCILRFPQNDQDNYCPLSGDLRVNEQPGLASLHTIFHNEHNRIVRKLTKINPHWDDDTLYEEARKIVAAEIQLINYKEWLPVVLGSRTVKKRGLSIKPKGFCDTYDDTIDASIDNAFATAILRFGHSLIHDIIARLTKKKKLIDEERLEDHYMSPFLYHIDDGFATDSIINWVSTVKCPRADRFIQPSARDLLFEDSQGRSFDLPALNIQRGRDHGLPNYNEYREFCGLPRATHFGTGPGGLVHHHPKVAALLRQAYNGCIDDIDLFVGSLTERRIKGALTGPLLQCSLVKQFQKLRDGDRFWFERNDPVTGFTEAQVYEIKKIGLSSVICANSSIKFMQRNAFISPRKSKRRNNRSFIRCDKLPQIDFRHWRDRK